MEDDISLSPNFCPPQPLYIVFLFDVYSVQEEVVATEEELAKHAQLAEDKAKEAEETKIAGAEYIAALLVTHAQVVCPTRISRFFDVLPVGILAEEAKGAGVGQIVALQATHAPFLKCEMWATGGGGAAARCDPVG